MERVLVHHVDETLHIHTEDGEEIETTPMHVFYVEDAGFMPAEYLEEGGILRLQNGDKTTVAALETEHLKEPVKVYNLEVEIFHTFFVSDIKICVHNDCSKVHNNSLNSKKKTVLYVLRDKDTNEAMKIGETTRGEKRYSKKFYSDNPVVNKG